MKYPDNSPSNTTAPRLGSGSVLERVAENEAQCLPAVSTMSACCTQARDTEGTRGRSDYGDLAISVELPRFSTYSNFAVSDPIDLKNTPPKSQHRALHSAHIYKPFRLTTRCELAC